MICDLKILKINQELSKSPELYHIVKTFKQWNCAPITHRRTFILRVYHYEMLIFFYTYCISFNLMSSKQIKVDYQ